MPNFKAIEDAVVKEGQAKSGFKLSEGAKAWITAYEEKTGKPFDVLKVYTVKGRSYRGHRLVGLIDNYQPGMALSKVEEIQAKLKERGEEDLVQAIEDVDAADEQGFFSRLAKKHRFRKMHQGGKLGKAILRHPGLMRKAGGLQYMMEQSSEAIGWPTAKRKSGHSKEDDKWQEGRIVIWQPGTGREDRFQGTIKKKVGDLLHVERHGTMYKVPIRQVSVVKNR